MFLSLVELTVLKYKKDYLLWQKSGGGGGGAGGLGGSSIFSS